VVCAQYKENYFNMWSLEQIIASSVVYSVICLLYLILAGIVNDV